MYTSYGEYVNKIVSTILLPLSIAIVLIFMEGAYFIMFQSDGWTIRQQVCVYKFGMVFTFLNNHLFPEGWKFIKRIEPFIRPIPYWKFE